MVAESHPRSGLLITPEQLMALLKITKANVDWALPAADRPQEGAGVLLGHRDPRLRDRGRAHWGEDVRPPEERREADHRPAWHVDAGPGPRAGAELAVEIDRRRAMDPVDAKAEKERKAARRLTLAQGLEEHLTALRAKRVEPAVD